VANRDSNWPRGYLTQRDRAALIKPNNIADIDADYGDCSLECLSHGIACWRGHEHGRTITLPDVRRLFGHCVGKCEQRRRSTALAKMLAEMGLTGLFSLGAQSRRADHSLAA